MNCLLSVNKVAESPASLLTMLRLSPVIVLSNVCVNPCLPTTRTFSFLIAWIAICVASWNASNVWVSSPATWAPLTYKFAISQTLSLPPNPTLNATSTTKSLMSSIQSCLLPVGGKKPGWLRSILSYASAAMNAALELRRLYASPAPLFIAIWVSSVIVVS